MSSEMVPVVQMDDRVALDAAREHLEENGYRAMVTPFSQLPESQRRDWIVPDNGGFLIYLEQAESTFEEAMTMLGDFFGYRPGDG